MKRTVKIDSARLEYTLIQTSRSNVMFKALPEGATNVYAPKWMSLKSIDDLVRENAKAIAKLHEKLDQRLNETAEKRSPLMEGSSVAVEGTKYALKLHTGSDKMRISEDGCLHLWTPDPGNQTVIRASLKACLASLALTRIRERLGVYGPRIGGEYHRVTIRQQRTRWGSCSSRHNLNFNWMLIMAPPQALDYVVVHELCHLHELNHSKRFWALVEQIMPDYKVWKKWLKVHGQELGI